ncbi:MogA/MoaB family molybdenum cofactor biosynthesis protein [Paraclostridium sordellii]|uniref:MogA/MoaB family molybdenum cofactor biosynthesis protein n=1 Tax=Paraclostridium sordellii TaxID=1505 RepID=UPI0005E3F6FA|nr:MogA/MoaB family molybdenum cofactor biosynthesis protein [Paeniclostridium sordellii]CEN81996.1 molybdenum cofactor biosynthesis protein MoaB [[Clostridium] sordellii] [Paeniclostridium sordellii]
MFNISIITLSDKGSKGEREDITGEKLIKFINNTKDYKVKYYNMIPDDKELLKSEIIKLCNSNIDLILTNGGTGFSKRDVTPEATKEVIEREIPGISEYIRMESSKIVKRAILSRGISGIRNNTVIINLPGSPKGAIESIEFVIDIIGHGIEILKGEAVECANDRPV